MAGEQNAIMNWPISSDGRYEPGLFVGSEGENGEHLRDTSGWPFSIYRKAAEPGVTDVVLCHGIQHRADANEVFFALRAYLEASGRYA